MKKIFLFYLLLLSIIYSGCEKNFDSVIDKSSSVYQVSSVRTIDSFRYIPGDSLVLISISFVNSNDLRDVFTDIISSSGQTLNNGSFKLYDNGKSENGDLQANDNTYSNKFPLSQLYPNGDYTIKYFVADKDNSIRQVAIQKFKFDNGQANVAPIVSNLIIPDTVSRDMSFIFSVSASDSNGLNDVQTVFFELFRPDSSQVLPSPGITKFFMHDDGDIEHYGDQIAGDGIFSYKNSFLNTAQTGEWKFVFQAIDRGEKASNTIIHFLQVQ